jgi:hypothetical protein
VSVELIPNDLALSISGPEKAGINRSIWMLSSAFSLKLHLAEGSLENSK